MSFVHSGGVDIYYERTGQGPALLFCHGAGSNAATWWQQIPAFSQRFTCIAFDARCFGRSVAPLEAFGHEALVADALAVLDAEGIDSAALVCQSLGGMTGARLALRHPERVWAFACCDSPLAIDHPRMLANVAAFLGEVAATELEDRALSPAFVRERPAMAWLYRQINQFNPAVHGAAAGDGGPGWGERLAALFAPEQLLALDDLRGIHCPTLFVVGAEDRVVTPAVVRDIARQVEGSRVAEIAAAGHSPYFEQAQNFNAAVLAFLVDAWAGARHGFPTAGA
ncbi:alpha/beta fold hydrolase [Variovorax sp. DAIF25]|uniref:alpha/beta fold hydrolase n=1 Tax=Variovorax sp. DAIF25 TaxID=3080983 RepID=UPI003D6C48FE